MAYNHMEWNFFHSNNEMFQASKSKWIYIFYVVALNIFFLIFYKQEPFCNSRDGITITRLQFTNDLSIFEQVNMENMTPLKYCLERLKINFLESSIIVGK